MPDRPPLPDSDDPFLVLGVESNVGERDLRRAYVALCKAYRPEHHPREFQRIHAAYENARARLRWDRFEADANEESIEEVPKDVETSDHPVEPSATSPEPTIPPAPTSAWSLAHNASVAEYLAALVAAKPVGTQALDNLDRDQLRDLCSAPELTWDVLREQGETSSLGLFVARVQGLVHRQDWMGLLAEIDCPSVRGDVLWRADLERLVAAAVLAAGHFEQEAADAAYERLLGQSSGTPEHNQLAEFGAVADSWFQAKELSILPAPLQRLVAAWPLTVEGDESALVADLCQDARSRRGQFILELSSLDEHLQAYLLDRLDDIAPFFDEFEDLSQDQRRWLQDARATLVRRTGPHPHERDPTPAPVLATTSVLLIVGSLVGRNSGGAVVLGLAVAVYLVWRLIARTHLPWEDKRDFLATAALEIGWPPDQTMEWALDGFEPRFFDLPADMDADLTSNLALHILAAIGRLAHSFDNLEPA